MKKILGIILGFFFVIPAVMGADVSDINKGAWLSHLKEMNIMRRQIVELSNKENKTAEDMAAYDQLMEKFEAKQIAWDEYITAVANDDAEGRAKVESKFENQKHFRKHGECGKHPRHPRHFNRMCKCCNCEKCQCEEKAPKCDKHEKCGKHPRHFKKMCECCKCTKCQSEKGCRCCTCEECECPKLDNCHKHCHKTFKCEKAPKCGKHEKCEKKCMKSDKCGKCEEKCQKKAKCEKKCCEKINYDKCNG